MLEPDTSAVIELGGEDAKVIFFTGGVDERMNGSCAGGTGAFIDQMAVLLNMTVAEMDAASLQAEKLYPIASRCGVFAKTDIQPLLNQGARKADVAASIYQAVVNQTIAGLAQGRKIAGKVLFLGGPLYYCKGLRARFRETLGLDDETAVFPAYGRFAVALGAAMYSATVGQAPVTFDVLVRRLRECKMVFGRDRLKPLFAGPAEYDAFCQRHARATVPKADLATYAGPAWLGIDCGSTTTKLALISQDRALLYTYYSANQGNPVQLVKAQLEEIYRRCGDRVTICGCAVHRLRRGADPATPSTPTWASSRPSPTIRRQNSSSRMWTLFWTSAGRISSALKFAMVPSTPLCSTKPVPPAAARLSRLLPSPWAIRVAEFAQQGAAVASAPVNLGSPAAPSL